MPDVPQLNTLSGWVGVVTIVCVTTLRVTELARALKHFRIIAVSHESRQAHFCKSGKRSCESVRVSLKCAFLRGGFWSFNIGLLCAKELHFCRLDLQSGVSE